MSWSRRKKHEYNTMNTGHHNYHDTMRSLTVEVALNLEVSHTEPEHGQLVQATSDLLRERQQFGESVQLSIQTVTVAFGRIGLHRRRLDTETTHRDKELLNDACLLKHVCSA